jgi:hypothetical protein
MFRKITCALVAAAALSTAALAPTAASARGWFGGVHAFHGAYSLGYRASYTWKGFCWHPQAYVCQ